MGCLATLFLYHNAKYRRYMSHRMEELKPEHYVTEKQCKEMIDEAIRQHNRNASILSMCLGLIFLALFAEGFFRVIGMIPPFLGIDVSIIHEVVEKVKEQLFQKLFNDRDPTVHVFNYMDCIGTHCTIFDRAWFCLL